MNRKKWKLPAVLTVVLLVLVACGGDALEGGAWVTNHDNRFWESSEHEASIMLDNGDFIAVSYVVTSTTGITSIIGHVIIANDVCGGCENHTFTRDDGAIVTRRTIIGTYSITTHEQDRREGVIEFICEHGRVAMLGYSTTRNTLTLANITYTRR